MADPFSEVEVARLATREQVVNLLEETIGELQSALGQFPGPYDPLNGAVYVRWERVTMS